MLTAITRAPSPAMNRCQLTHLPREPIDVARVTRQHAAYEERLRRLGCAVLRLPDAPDLPDSVFVEDMAVVLDEIAIVTRCGAPSRRAEASSVALALSRLRPLARIQPPGTLDGGDVLLAARTLYVGRSGRTNDAGIAQLRAAVEPLGYAVTPVDVRGCLHLKSAVSMIAEGHVLVNRAWLDPEPFAALDQVEVDAREPFAANALRVGAAVLYADAFPRTRERLEQHGIAVHTVDVSELAKAEGAVTCCSLILRA